MECMETVTFLVSSQVGPAYIYIYIRGMGSTGQRRDGWREACLLPSGNKHTPI